jgi:hypothetical protein
VDTEIVLTGKNLIDAIPVEVEEHGGAAEEIRSFARPPGQRLSGPVKGSDHRWNREWVCNDDLPTRGARNQATDGRIRHAGVLRGTRKPSAKTSVVLNDVKWAACKAGEQDAFPAESVKVRNHQA